ncbi:CDP-alcohol phosphatidyltransferase family protein [Flavobacterium stagni]|uniref:Phosphatidylserine synthase n=1 Tax=Flavobacterium stagni TaxID=2506421 RepID=A0A4Q1K7X3_9FLAO|nr:CDP-alcohol phosphatidyltransferase family protein [Flavobacterium stagni]RXR21843.1 phosphatidylserine synthase [Flavobacterium stagni]
MSVKKHIPNLLTLLNLFCGCIAIVLVSDFNFEYAFYFVCLGIFFDFFDGFFARKFGVAGPLGVQLDSLADMVTSGVAPGYTMVYLLSGMTFHMPLADYLPYLGFIITLGACYRLANFNIDTRQSDSFIGLPTPANTLFIMSLPLVLQYQGDTFWGDLLVNKYVLLSITVLSAFVMNAEIPLFSLKIKNFSVAKYKLQIGFVFFSVALIVLLKVVAVPLIIVSYVLLSVLNTIFSKKELA